MRPTASLWLLLLTATAPCLVQCQTSPSYLPSTTEQTNFLTKCLRACILYVLIAWAQGKSIAEIANIFQNTKVLRNSQNLSFFHWYSWGWVNACNTLNKYLVIDIRKWTWMKIMIFFLCFLNITVPIEFYNIYLM